MNYTHKVFWEEFHPFFGFYIKKDFKTTEDAVKLHLYSLLKKSDEKNIIGIGCEVL